MHPSILKIHELLVQLQGKDTAKMTPDVLELFKESTSNSYIDATAGLNELLLGRYRESPRWLWKMEKNQSLHSELIGTYSIIDTAQMEAAIGKDEKIQMAAALFPSLSLAVNLFAAYHHSGGFGLQVDPRISIIIEVSGDPDLILMEESLKVSKSLFPVFGNGISVSIRPLECCCESSENPADFVASFSRVAAAARQAAIKEHGDTIMTEAIEVGFNFDVTAGSALMEEAFEYAGLLFASVIVCQDKE